MYEATGSVAGEVEQPFGDDFYDARLEEDLLTLAADDFSQVAARRRFMMDRPALAHAARMLLLATLIIVIDIRIGSFDLINDLVGAVLVLIAITRLRIAVPEPARLHSPLYVLAVVGIGAAIAEQIDPGSIVGAILGWSNAFGAWLTARLLAAAFAARGDDLLAAQWSASERLILWLGIIPLVSLSTIGWMLSPGSADLGGIGIMIIVLAALPLLHLLISLYGTSVPASSSTR